MYQTIHEPISVLGIFHHGTFQPKKFRWGQRTLPVESITYQAELKDGNVRYRQYSVTSGGNVYRLRFLPTTLDWWLEEVWCEG